MNTEHRAPFNELARLTNGGNRKPHRVIRGDNLPVMHALHAEGARFEAIYADPPYNTRGSELTYTDRFGKAGVHDEWVSFMRPRLQVARELLTADGILILAIGDEALAPLRLLADEVFGGHNHLGTVVWEGATKNMARFVSVEHDYMLIYTRDLATLRRSGVRWREPKRGAELALVEAARIWQECKGDARQAGAAISKWYKENPQLTEPSVRQYKFFNGQGELYCKSGLGDSSAMSDGARYEVLHPTTSKPVPMPSRGWIYPSAERFQEMVDSGRVAFGADETTSPFQVARLADTGDSVVRGVFREMRSGGTAELRGVFGVGDTFTYPKNTSVLMRWLRIVTNGNPAARVLDFFGGSGSTTHAVMKMNAEDGGTRTSTLVTLDEAGIYDRVTRPRIETVVTGVRADGSRYSDGFAENVLFESASHVIPLHVTETHCVGCGTPVQQPTTGRKRKWCGETCRIAAWRRKRGVEPDAVAS